MPTNLIKIKDRYFEWSTVSDSPATWGMTLDDLRRYIQEEYGNIGLNVLPERLKRIDQFGTSCLPNTMLADFLIGNRAGDNEEELDIDQIYKKFTKEKPYG